jgi:ribosomal protein L37AE/L43A
MGAECYCCLEQEGTIDPDETGNQQRPVAACEKCHSFVCDQHGQRDAQQKYWRCVQCLAALIGLAATSRSSHSTLLTRLVAHSLASADLRYAYESLDDFVERNPPFDWVIAAVEHDFSSVAARIHDHSQLADAWEALDYEGQRMFTAAIVIVRELGLSRGGLPEFLVIVGETLDLWPDEE